MEATLALVYKATLEMVLAVKVIPFHDNQGSQQLGFVPSYSEFEWQLGMLGFIAILVVLLGFCRIKAA